MMGVKNGFGSNRAYLRIEVLHTVIPGKHTGGGKVPLCEEGITADYKVDQW